MKNQTKFEAAKKSWPTHTVFGPVIYTPSSMMMEGSFPEGLLKDASDNIAGKSNLRLPSFRKGKHNRPGR